MATLSNINTFKQLAPEQRRALRVLSKTNRDKASSHFPTLEEVTTAGATTAYTFKITTKELPKGQYWCWNQCRKQISVQDSALKLDICFFKLSTKLKDASKINPSHKLWVYNISHMETKKQSSLLWCERGYTEHQSYLNDSFLSEPPELILPIIYPKVIGECAQYEVPWSALE